MENSTEGFVIDNDNKADWALEQIKEKEVERDRLISIAKAKIQDLDSQIEEIESKCNSETAYLKGLLAEYFVSVPHKETKTQEAYKLLSGTLVFKKPSVKINHDDEKLIKALDGTEFIETKKSLKWGEYKKVLMINDDDKVIDTETGEVVDACSVEEVPGKFEVKF